MSSGRSGSGPTVLKLGGSVVTEKDRPETVDGAALDRAAEAIGAALDDSAGRTPAGLVVVHGGGSFGHHHASEHGVSTTTGSKDPDAVLAIHSAMTTLNRFVVDRLRTRDVPAVPVNPLSVAHRDRDGKLTLPSGQVRVLVGEGFVPVLHGDVVAHEGAGVTVLSGDEIVADLAWSLDAESVGVCSTVPGVLDGDGEVIPRIEEFDAVKGVLAGSDATDVSGGMEGKVRELLALDAPTSIFDLDDLAEFLSGEQPGTTLG